MYESVVFPRSLCASMVLRFLSWAPRAGERCVLRGGSLRPILQGYLALVMHASWDGLVDVWKLIDCLLC